MKIIYEDKDILVVHKEAGLPVQSRSALTQDLESMLLADFIKKNKGQQKPELHVINRLDQPVEGLVLFAKNKKAAAGLTRQVVAQGTPKSKQAVLSYKKLSDSDLEIRLMTGRHHQIRVQLSNAGMPIKGDRKYGRPDPDYHGRLMLTACRLSFIHPGTGKLMELSI